MKSSHQLVKYSLQLIKQMLGKNKGIFLLKCILRNLPYRYAFSVTWLCLDEFPFNELSKAEYTYGFMREFPLIKIKVNPNCLHARFFVLSGYYEELLSKEISLPRRKGLLVDVGANFGYYSVLWLQKSDTRVIAVEPVEEYVELLNENLQNYKSRYSIFMGCIGDSDRTALLYTHGEPTMLSEVVNEVVNNDNIEATESLRSVKMVTLASLLKELNEEKIDVLKIDAQGYDAKILENSKPLFEAGVIASVFWEPSNAILDKDIANFLENLGYQKILETDYIIGYEVFPS